mmetsp:Transcript_20813/g.49435  ORF Transcript_20813/g.49435 Transcript_20813/m.49435 type:complete len:80 (+) Transcript_20813:676-915(+)
MPSAVNSVVSPRSLEMAKTALHAAVQPSGLADLSESDQEALELFEQAGAAEARGDFAQAQRLYKAVERKSQRVAEHVGL